MCDGDVNGGSRDGDGGGDGNDGDGDEYGNADSDDGNASLSSLCPHPSVFRPSLHSPSLAQDFHCLLLGASVLRKDSQT